MTGIITLFADQYRLLEENCSIERRISVSGMDFFRGLMNDRELIFTRVGDDPVLIAMAAQILADKFDIGDLIYSGTAASIAPFLSEGDIVIANYVIWTGPGLPTRAGGIEELAKSALMLEGDAAVLDRLRIAVRNNETGVGRVKFGTLIRNGYRPVDDPVVARLGYEYGAVAADNCGAALARVCDASNIPFTVIDIADVPENPDSPGTDGIPHKDIVNILFGLISSVLITYEQSTAGRL